jgi:hypothetical protein
VAPSAGVASFALREASIEDAISECTSMPAAVISGSSQMRGGAGVVRRGKWQGAFSETGGSCRGYGSRVRRTFRGGASSEGLSGCAEEEHSLVDDVAEGL